MEPIRLIEEVEARPGLFNKSLPEYTNKKIKDLLWMDVTRALIEDFDDLSEVEKNVQCREVQLKWKHIRDNFRRELQAQKNPTPGAKKKRKYIYFDHMVFLIPYVNDGLPSENCNTTENIDTDPLDSPPTMNRSPPRNTYTRTSNSFTKKVIQQRRMKKKTTFEEEILKNLKSKNELDTDEDRTFCLSLVASMKKMNYATKLNAKIDILKVIRQYTVPQIDVKSEDLGEESS